MFRHIGIISGTIALFGLIGIGIVASPVASATTTGSISGTVTNSTSVPEANVCVNAYNTSQTFSATTDTSGNYTISNLPPGDYIVEFDPSCGGTIASSLAIQYYYEANEISGADVIGVGTSNVPGINGTLGEASTITGTVTNSEHIDVEDVCVLLYSADGYLFPAAAVTNSSGDYSIGSLPNGTYTVLFDPTCLGSISSSYAFQYYNGEPDYGVATPVAITPPTPETNINAMLAPGASISGTITAPFASNSGDVCVDAYSADGQLQNIAVTNGSGAYDITNLPAESYKIAFDPTCGGDEVSDFGTGWYQYGDSFASATNETLIAGQSLTGINDTITLDVEPLQFSSTSLPSGTESTSYTANLGASGGTEPYDWVANGLPSGLSMNAATGQITGTPTSSGNFTVSVSVTDTSAQPLTVGASIPLTIATPPVPTTTMAPPRTKTVCSIKTKKVAVDKIEVKGGKRITVVTHKTVDVYKTVTIRTVKKVHGKKVIVITHKKEPVKTCKSVTVS